MWYYWCNMRSEVPPTAGPETVPARPKPKAEVSPDRRAAEKALHRGLGEEIRADLEVVSGVERINSPSTKEALKPRGIPDLNVTAPVSESLRHDTGRPPRSIADPDALSKWLTRRANGDISNLPPPMKESDD